MMAIRAVQAAGRVARRLVRRRALFILVLTLACATVCLAVGPVRIAPFSTMEPERNIPAPWQALTFPNIDRHTQYRAVQMEGLTVIQAHSRNSASGLIHDLNFHPEAYPWLHWRWRIQGILEKGDVTTRQGDDCAARLYVAFEFVPADRTLWERVRHKAACIAAGRRLPGSALTYIWANKAAQGTIIDSPYTDRSKMVVVQSGAALASRWVDEQRNIKDDYQAAYGQAPPPVIGIAIMTDTDNTAESATAFYGDIGIAKTEPGS
jgi:hypothetical protein